MSLHTGVNKYFVIIPTFKSFVTEKMNFIVFIFTDVSQTVGFVPPLRENIKGDLTTNGILEIQMSKSLLQRCYHFLSNIIRLYMYIICKTIFQYHHVLTKSNTSYSFLSSLLQFLPIGEILSIPVLNSIKVPLWMCQQYCKL